VVRRPAGLPATAAAALPTAWLTAWNCLRRLARATAGDDVLVFAAANGADATIDHTEEDVLERVRALTDSAGAGVVLDAVGGSTFALALQAAGHGGRVVALANVALAPEQRSMASR
jgi:NADPH2:quinone reductase